MKRSRVRGFVSRDLAERVKILSVFILHLEKDLGIIEIQ